MTADTDVYDLRTQRIWLGDDGIIRVVLKPNTTIELVDAKGSVEVSARLAGGARCPVLVDMTATGGMSREARRFYGGTENARHHNAQALIVNAPVARAIGNFFMGINNPIIPTRLFTDEGEALAWLGTSGPRDPPEISMIPHAAAIQIRAYSVWMGDDGIVRAVVRPSVSLEIADALESMEISRQLVGAVRAPILIDCSALVGFSRDARRFYATPEPARYHTALAVLVNSPVARAIGSFFMGINRPVVPTRLFTDEGEAVSWLKAQPS